MPGRVQGERTLVGSPPGPAQALPLPILTPSRNGEGPPAARDERAERPPGCSCHGDNPDRPAYYLDDRLTVG